MRLPISHAEVNSTIALLQGDLAEARRNNDRRAFFATLRALRFALRYRRDWCRVTS